jgi:hypothetical protein
MQEKVIHYIKKALQLLGRCAVPGLGEFKFIKTDCKEEHNTGVYPVLAGLYKLVLNENDLREYSILTTYIRLNENIAEEVIDEEIHLYIKDLKSQLYSNKTFTLDTLGILTLGENGEILFNSNLFVEKNIDKPYHTAENLHPVAAVSNPVIADEEMKESETIIPEPDSNRAASVTLEESVINEMESEEHELPAFPDSLPLLKAKNKKSSSSVLLLILIFSSLMVVYPAFKKPSRTNNVAALILKDSTIIPRIDTVTPISFIDTNEILVTITNEITAEEFQERKAAEKAAIKQFIPSLPLRHSNTVPLMERKLKRKEALHR